MTEAESHFWGSLEYRVCSETAGLCRKALRRYWCDGFIPDNYHLDDPVPRIEGRVWMVNGCRDELWSFTLLLGKPIGSVEEVNWASLLPPEEVTRWLTMDLRRQHLVIEPSVTIPDLPPRPLER